MKTEREWIYREVQGKKYQMQELVRCKDCIHFHYMKCSYPERGTCDLWNMLHWGDWFCADGERR